MRIESLRPLINTTQALCRMCYTCVREGLGKAIRITEGLEVVTVSKFAAQAQSVG